MFTLPSRRVTLRVSLVLLSLVIACSGPGEACESESDERNREMSEELMAGASIPPKVTSIEAKLAVPVTTYTVTTETPLRGIDLPPVFIPLAELEFPR